mmetsp:Transcript_6862/g.10455  ORF Transcript_6862/g.10455 Transcript_6862/m.10455 type:complete len:264 (-) Transcript_6862:308-1099(-)
MEFPPQPPKASSTTSLPSQGSAGATVIHQELTRQVVKFAMASGVTLYQSSPQTRMPASNREKRRRRCAQNLFGMASGSGFTTPSPQSPSGSSRYAAPAFLFFGVHFFSGGRTEEGALIIWTNLCLFAPLRPGAWTKRHFFFSWFLHRPVRIHLKQSAQMVPSLSSAGPSGVLVLLLSPAPTLPFPASAEADRSVPLTTLAVLLAATGSGGGASFPPAPAAPLPSTRTAAGDATSSAAAGGGGGRAMTDRASSETIDGPKEKIR